jgi:hypothetical protein
MLSYFQDIPFAANALKDGRRICDAKEFYVFSKYTCRNRKISATWCVLLIYPPPRHVDQHCPMLICYSSYNYFWSIFEIYSHSTIYMMITTRFNNFHLDYPNKWFFDGFTLLEVSEHLEKKLPNSTTFHLGYPIEWFFGQFYPSEGFTTSRQLGLGHQVQVACYVVDVRLLSVASTPKPVWFHTQTFTKQHIWLNHMHEAWLERSYHKPTYQYRLVGGSLVHA